MEITQWLTSTTASEVMVCEVFTLNTDDTLALAAAMFLREQISGAPVVNGEGKCVGVISTSDLADAERRAARERERIASSSFFKNELALPARLVEAELEKVRDKFLPTAVQPVERFMTADTVSVTPDAPLSEVVRDMVEAHVHRVLVVSEEEELQGIISTTDVLAALLRVSSTASV